jgi:hypothetical protein
MTTLTEYANWIRHHPIQTLSVVGIATYLGKYLQTASNYNNDGLVCLLCPVICVLYVPYMFSFCYSIIAIFKHMNIVVFPAVIIVFLIAFQLPLPPLPRGDAAQHFVAHRQQYENIIEELQQGNLESLQIHSSFRNIDISKYDPLVVVFTPTKASHSVVIVYADKKAHLERTQVCDEDGSIYTQLDTHWWICHIDWL